MAFVRSALIALSTLAVLQPAPLLAKSPVKSPAPTGTGTVTIVSSTAGAEVMIDGAKAGVVPLPAPLSYTAGEHTIKVQKAGFAPFIDVFNITKKKDTKLEIDLVPVSGIANVTCDVEKARVFVDGKFICEAPCAADIGVGAHAVQVSKGGYKDFVQNINAVAGQEVALDVKLEELPMGLNPYKPPPPPPPKWYEKWWLWTAVGGGAAVLIVAIVVPVTLSQQDPIKNFNPTYTFGVTWGMK